MRTTGVAVTALVSTDVTFASGLSYNGTTDPAQDFTIHIDATGLRSGTRYYYRFIATGATSLTGTFVTAPDPSAPAPVNFGFTGDADGLMRPYPATFSSHFTPPGASGFGTNNFDFFVWLGDTIYETASGPPNTSPAVAIPPVISDYWRKYREQFFPVNTGPYPGLTNFFDSNGHYTLIDNHELGNREFINGGAPAAAPFNTTNPVFDVNVTGTYMHNNAGFKTTLQAYTGYQPIRSPMISAPGDTRTDGTQKMFFAQRWGANAIFINVDDRSYRDIRLRNASGDDNGPRADNPLRTMLGATQLAWLEQTLSDAEAAGVAWKIVAISSPIDQIGPIGGSFILTNGPNNGPGTYSTTESDGGKSWMGGYRTERNTLLKYIADNHIRHVLFITTDDHQVRINELGYFTQFDANNTPIQSSYIRVPGVFLVVAGPIGATGPDGITDHSFANILTLAQNFSALQTADGIDPVGLDPNFPGLHNVVREGDPSANTTRQTFDFYSPDTFNYVSFNIGTCPTLTASVYGINSYATNTLPQPPATSNVRPILSFQVDGDITPPLISAVVANPNSLWPPNQKMVPVTISVAATDACGIASEKIVSVTSNEPSDGTE
jgi:hypothetical protein